MIAQLTLPVGGGKIRAANGICRVLGSFSPQEAFETPLWPVVALALGLIVGSFANVCIHRLPLRQSVVRPRSRCPHCGAAISAADNVPLLSYALLRGRCRFCRAPISIRYPLVEAANGVLYLGLALQLGPTPRTAVLMSFVTAMLVLSLIDLDHQILPDVVTIPGIAIGLATSPLPGAPGLLKAAIGAVAGYCFLRLFTWAYYVARRVEGMGQGDWKMTAMIGAFLGWDQALLVVVIASVIGSAVGIALMVFSGGDWRKTKIPLGTFLGIAGIVVTFVGSPIVAWYRGLLRG
jgi:leader peptidase (prepilin peptidase)/N-methyltransferase